MGFDCLNCTRRFSQCVLLILNIIVTMLGLAVMIIGIWARVNEKKYFEIADNTQEFTDVTVLAIVLGIFILLIGFVGVLGAVFASNKFGRVILMIYAIVLGLLVICEIGGGIAAAVKKDSVENVFRDSTNRTFDNYNQTSETWDSFQRTFKCCGPFNYTDYSRIFNVNTKVPESCCNRTTEDREQFNCQEVASDYSAADIAAYRIYNEGCADAVIDALRHNLGAIAGGAITIGLLQIVAVVMACFVALFKRDENKYEVV